MSLSLSSASSSRFVGRLSLANDQFSTHVGRLASGRRVNSAADDATGLAVATGLETLRRSSATAIRNANDGISLIQVAEGALGSAVESLFRLRELAVQASSGQLTSTERGFLDDEVASIIDDLDRLAENTRFNGMQLANDNSAIFSIQVGLTGAAGGTVDIYGGDVRSSYLFSGGGRPQVDTEVNALASIDEADRGIGLVNRQRSRLGAAHRRLEHALGTLQAGLESRSGAASRILDADYAVETSAMTRAKLLTVGSAAALLHHRRMPTMASRLLA